MPFAPDQAVLLIFHSRFVSIGRLQSVDEKKESYSYLRNLYCINQNVRKSTESNKYILFILVNINVEH